MTKGPLVYTAIVLAAILMVVSSMILLFRNIFTDNPELMMGISSILAIAVIVVLLIMLLRMKRTK